MPCSTQYPGFLNFFNLIKNPGPRPVKVVKKSELTTISEQEQEKYRKLEAEQKEAEIKPREIKII